VNRYGSRKFILALLALAASTWLVYEHAITPDVWRAVVLGTVGVYIVGNVAQKATSKDAA
jgi:hypothetical protein